MVDPVVMNFADTKYSDLNPIDLVRLGYLLLLRRPVDPTGLGYWTQHIRRHRRELLVRPRMRRSLNRARRYRR